MDNQVTPGWKTSEFWLHIVGQVPAVLGIIMGASNPVVLGVSAVCGLASAIYTACRSQVKVAALVSGAQAATTAINSAPKA